MSLAIVQVRIVGCYSKVKLTCKKRNLYFLQYEILWLEFRMRLSIELYVY